jgi:hypothetical protein
LGFDGLDSLFELGDKVVIRQGICVVDHVCSRRCRFGDVCDGLATGTIDGRKVDDDISRLIDQVAKHSVGTGAGIGDENTAFDGGIEEFCDSFPGLIEQSGIVVTNENIRSFL